MRASNNRDRIRCFTYRKFDHFPKDCLNSQTEKDPEQIQQMYNLDVDQTALKVLAADMYDNLIRTNSDDTIVHHLNLYKVRIATLHFAFEYKNRWTS